MSNAEYKNVAFYEAIFYRLDDDGNPLEDENGKTILYTAPGLEFDQMADYVEVKHLEKSKITEAWWD